MTRHAGVVVTVLSAVAVVAACTPAQEQQAAPPAAVSPQPAPVAPAVPTETTVTEAPVAVASSVTISAGAVVSDVTVGAAPSSSLSSIEIEVAEVLSEFQAERRQGDTVLTVPEQVLFAFDSADLKPGAAAALDGIAKVLNFYERAPVEIRGHTDARGSDAYNQNLSERRAAAVRGYFADEHDIPRRRLDAVGLGESHPVAPNTIDGQDNPAGRRQNRRVEIVVEGVTEQP